MAKRKVSRKYKPKKMMEQAMKDRKAPKSPPKKKTDWKQFIKNIPKKVVKFIKDVVRELKKVSWPSRKTLLTYTVVVIVTIIFFSALLGLFDFLFQQVVTLFINL